MYKIYKQTRLALHMPGLPSPVYPIPAQAVVPRSIHCHQWCDPSPGRSLRLKGKGWPLKTGRGDLLFTLSLQWPSQWSETQRSLLERLREERGDDPRRDWLQTARL